MIVALAGGVGAAKFLQGLVRATDPAELTVIVNTGDDITLYGLHVSPDLDSVTYTLADANDSDRGWGLAHETFRCLEHLSRYPVPSWFQLGDGDLATHLFRTSRLAEGARLSEVTAEIAEAWGVGARILPMTDDKVTTRVVIEEAGTGRGMDLHFQEYFVERQAQDPVREINYEGIEVADPAPGFSMQSSQPTESSSALRIRLQASVRSSQLTGSGKLSSSSGTRLSQFLR